MADAASPKFWKWVGYTTAILSLIAGVRQTVKLVTDRAETRHRSEALLASEQIQLRNQDFPQAWQTLEQAAKSDPDSPSLHRAQETLAMAWLENARAGENQKFSAITEKVDPILTRGVTESKSPQHQADLLAHLGWSYFLRSRDGVFGTDPAATYADAITRDPVNPFAHAMWGHWLYWNHGDIKEANRHFAIAVSSGREKEFVRRFQLTALLNSNSDDAAEEAVRVLNAMRMQKEPLPPESTRRQLFVSTYGRLIPGDAESPRFINAVPAAEHVLTFHWVFDTLPLADFEELRRATELCLLQEAAGQREEARAGFEAIRRQLAGRTGSLLTTADAGLKRLAK